MRTMDKRLSKLEQITRVNVDERLFIVLTALESDKCPSEHEPIGLSVLSKSGQFIPRLPNESVDALYERAAREHPEVIVWVNRYGGDDNEI